MYSDKNWLGEHSNTYPSSTETPYKSNIFCKLVKERVSEITEDINSSIKEIEDGDSDKFTNATDLFEKLGWVDNRTEREKKFSLEIAEIDGRAKNKIYKKYFEMEKHYLTQNID